MEGVAFDVVAVWRSLLAVVLLGLILGSLPVIMWRLLWRASGG